MDGDPEMNPKIPSFLSPFVGERWLLLAGTIPAERSRSFFLPLVDPLSASAFS